MKVVLIYRQPKLDAYSIETLFSAIATELGAHVELVEYRMGPRKALLADIRKLRSLRADIFHITGDVSYAAMLLPRRKTVLTIHDIGHFLYSLRGLKRWIYKQLWIVLPIRAAAAVTAVSDTTAQDIVRHLGVPAERINVIRNCYGPIFRRRDRPFDADRPLVLQVGTKAYKNVNRLIEALRGLPCRLLLIGRLDEATQRQLEECRIDYECRSDLTQAEIFDAYVESDLVSFISIGEGFGVPIIEAQAVGRALITSDVAPMSVVAGEGACTVSPTDVPAIRRGIERLIGDAAYRQQVVEAGMGNAARYSPAAVANDYVDLYRRVCAS